MAVFTSAVKLLMLAVYGYSVFFWGSVTLVTGIGGGYDGDFAPPAWVLALMGTGWLALTAAMVLSYLKKDITAFLLSAAGTAAFLWAAGWFVSTIRELLETKDVAADLFEMDSEYIRRYFPAAAIPVLALVPAVLGAAKILKKHRQKKEQQQNQPVKSVAE